MELPNIRVLNRYVNVNLSTKITLGFIMIGLVMVFITIKNYTDMKNLIVELDTITERVNPVIRQSTHIDSVVSAIEPLILKMMTTRDPETYQVTASNVRKQIQLIEKKLNDLENFKASASTHFDQDFLDSSWQLTANFANSKAIYEELLTIQQTIILNIDEVNRLSTEIETQEKQLKPLIEDVLFKVYDEFLVSMIHEMSGSLINGVLIIERIKNVNSLEELEEQEKAFKNWLGSHGNIIVGLLTGSSEDYFLEFMRELTAVYNAMIELLEGERGLIVIQNEKFNNIKREKAILETINSVLAQNKQGTSEILVQSLSMSEGLVESFRDSAAAQNQFRVIIGLAVMVFILLISSYIITYFRQSIKFIEKELSFLATGKLRPLRESDKQDEFSRLNNSLVTVIDSLKKIIAGIKDSSKQVSASVKTVSEGAVKTSDNMSLQQAELTHVNASLEQMNQLADTVVKSAEETYQKIEDASQHAVEGRNKVLASRVSVEKVVEQTKIAINVVKGLDEGVSNIESLMETISNIADMTNLLALNAAIEAARAGEHGRGFAVVADEVRMLANRTQEATVEIHERTIGMIKESREAVEMMELSEELVVNSLDQAQDADNTIARFSDIMDQVKALSRQIAAASDDQFKRVQDLNDHIEKVSALSEQSMQHIEKANSASSDQANISAGLKSKVKQFIVEREL